ncbi:hypothetical protein [Planktomarina temperata]|uniref:Uncharacterized protein n=1 Tax=Planktomarina temperata RCA23 TaxID=666509 RepID=A0AAN0RKU9_9RHOB|nr:hypothetical protein RCA23_c23510 [Planktomarina temperata RCA23]
MLIEPHTGSILISPNTTRDLVAMVPALKIVLDHSHFVAMGYITPIMKVGIDERTGYPFFATADLADGRLNLKPSHRHPQPSWHR